MKVIIQRGGGRNSQRWSSRSTPQCLCLLSPETPIHDSGEEQSWIPDEERRPHRFRLYLLRTTRWCCCRPNCLIKNKTHFIFTVTFLQYEFRSNKKKETGIELWSGQNNKEAGSVLEGSWTLCCSREDAG